MKMLRLALVAWIVPAAVAAEPALPQAGLVFRVSKGGIGGKLTPEVEIFADGTVRVGGKKASARMPRAELEALLRFVVSKRKFFAFDEKAVAKTIARRQPGPMCGTGVTTSGVTVVTRTRRATKRQMLLETYADRHADIAGLTDLRAIVRRLQLEGRLAQAGGRARVEGWRKQANARLAKRHGKEPPLGIETFRGLRDLPQGDIALRPQDDPALRDVHGRCAVFKRYVGTPQRIVSAMVRTDGKAAAVHVQP
ncbi:MAG: hypothetical protein ACYTGI_09910 [Planctomycetota bacterium]|jgi:hypothetical protein